MEAIMKSLKLSFFNPNAIESPLGGDVLMRSVTFSESERLLSFTSEGAIHQIVLPLADKVDLQDIELVDGNLTLALDGSEVIVPNVNWIDSHRLNVAGTGVLDTDGKFYPLTAIGGISVNETEDSIELDYVEDTNTLTNNVAQAAGYVSGVAVGQTGQLVLMSTTQPEEWLTVPMNFIDDRRVLGISLGANDGVVLPPGTYYLEASTNAFAPNRSMFRLTDGINILSHSINTFAASTPSANTAEAYGIVSGHYRCTAPTEIYLQGIIGRLGTPAAVNPRFGRYGRALSQFPASAPTATIDIFKIDDSELPILTQPVMTPLLQDMTGYETATQRIYASSEYSTTYRAWQALADMNTQIWASATGTNQWIAVELKVTPVIANAFMFVNRVDNITISQWARAYRLEYKPDDVSDWIHIVDSDDCPPYSGSAAFYQFGEYLTIKHFRLTILDAGVSGATVAYMQLLDFQQPIME